MIFKSIDPHSEKVICRFSSDSEKEIQKILAQSKKAYSLWSVKPIEERARCVQKLGAELRARRQQLAEWISLEMGKPLIQSIAEIDKCAALCDYYSENATDLLKDEPVLTEAKRSLVRLAPMGAILGVMPWNFPFWQVIRFAIPALLLGNVVLLKHAPNVFGCAERLEKLFENSNFPSGVFQNLLIDVKALQTIVKDPFIRGTSLTGSSRAGKSFAALSGKYLKKSVLELGGSDPYLVLSDADLSLAVDVCVKSRLINSGQSCVAAKRFIVDKSVVKSFTELFVERMKNAKVGNPLSLDTDVGPLARKDLLLNLNKQFQASVKKGAKIALNKKIAAKSKGFYFFPAVLTNVQPGMAAFDEETFGPLAAIIAARDEDEAVELANHSDYGLGSAIFSKDTDRALRISKRLDAGNVYINSLVKSDPRLPFGGTKESGFGRELSHFGLQEFANIQTVSVA